MSSFLTENERFLLRRDGHFMIRYLASLIAQVVFWGMYIVVVSFSTYSLCSRGIRNSRPRLIMLVVTFFLFSASTVILAIDIYWVIVQVQAINLSEGPTLDDRKSSVDSIFVKVYYACSLIFALEFLIGDAVVLWRTWAVWQGRKMIVLIPLVPWFGSFVSFLIWAGLVLSSGISRPNLAGGDDVENVLLATWVLSMVANGLATCMIALRAWQHRRVLKASYESTGKRTMVERVLALLVESGFIYLILWSVQTISFVKFQYGSAGNVVSLTLEYMGNQLVGMYPTVIIVLVELQRTIWDSPDESRSGEVIRSGIHFSEATTINIGFQQSNDVEGKGDIPV